jgi:hypothetical protein
VEKNVSTTTTSPTNIIPTLDSQSILTSPIDQIGYIIRYYCTAPKSISNTTFAQMISIADTISRYQGNKSTLTQQITNDLNSVFNRFFPLGSTIINVTTTDNDDGSYNVTIGVSAVINGVNYSLGANVGVTTTGILTLKWTPQFN